MGSDGAAFVLISSGFDAGKLTEVVEAMKSSSKSAGTHKRRQLYWAAYGGILSRISGVNGDVDGIFTFTPAGEGEDGTVDFAEFTKKQRHALASGS